MLPQASSPRNPAAPVNFIEPDKNARDPEGGIALCLSGGGYRTLLVSDGGGKMAAEPEPKADWGRHSYRVLNVIDNQVRALRKRQLIDSLANPDDEHDGAYWGIRTHLSDYGLADALPCPDGRTSALANVPTRLKRMEPELQEQLINWGYAVCDAALRRHCVQSLGQYQISVVQQPRFPYMRGV